ncbi:MAG: cytochrome c-type biogenesis protein CcmH [Nitrosomonadales bacterium]|nr:cytochrome c-type biogenesis protein CcmH [Nitrosomonadales bacterium]
MKRLLILVMCLLPVYAMAGEAQDLAKDPVLEKRMIGLAERLRCLVCQNESLASSHSELAEDLRREVREQMSKGMNDEEIIDYLVARYGDFVLYDPRVKSNTLLLWFGPFVLLGGGGVMLVYQLRKRKRTLAEKETELTPEAAQRAAQLLNEQKDPQA